MSAVRRLARSRLPPGCPLTPRQHEILCLLASGMRIRDVARRLRLSESAVRAHCSFAYRRLGVTGQGQAVVLLVREGWLDGHPGPAVPEDFRASPTQQSYLAAFDRFVREGRRADRRLMQIGLIAMRCERRRHPDQAMEERDAGIERLIDRIAS